MADIQKLEQELKAIARERDQVEKNWKEIEFKERQTERKYFSKHSKKHPTLN
jgi:hypothetical protein